MIESFFFYYEKKKPYRKKCIPRAFLLGKWIRHVLLSAKEDFGDLLVFTWIFLDEYVQLLLAALALGAIGAIRGFRKDMQQFMFFKVISVWHAEDDL